APIQKTRCDQYGCARSREKIFDGIRTCDIVVNQEPRSAEFAQSTYSGSRALFEIGISGLADSKFSSQGREADQQAGAFAFGYPPNAIEEISVPIRVFGRERGLAHPAQPLHGNAPRCARLLRSFARLRNDGLVISDQDGIDSVELRLPSGES